MTSAQPPNTKYILDSLDLSAIADSGDKRRECEYFYSLAALETDRERFRWLISGFLNAAYSFFESSALSAFVRFTDMKTGYPLEDSNYKCTDFKGWLQILFLDLDISLKTEPA